MAETTITYEKGKLYHLDLAQLQTDPHQPRKYLDPQALDELAASIAQHGVLEPILFRAVTVGIWGHDAIASPNSQISAHHELVPNTAVHLEESIQGILSPVGPD